MTKNISIKSYSESRGCDKVTFSTLEIALKRAIEINKENAGLKGVRLMRAYKCNTCGLFHLTSMSKFYYSITKDFKAREEYRRKIFIERESYHYEKKFGLI